jgi:hypothetical protein
MEWAIEGAVLPGKPVEDLSMKKIGGEISIPFQKLHSIA